MSLTIAAALDPTIKVAYTKELWSAADHKRGMTLLRKKVRWCARSSGNTTDIASDSCSSRSIKLATPTTPLPIGVRRRRGDYLYMLYCGSKKMSFNDMVLGCRKLRLILVLVQIRRIRVIGNKLERVEAAWESGHCDDR